MALFEVPTQAAEDVNAKEDEKPQPITKE